MSAGIDDRVYPLAVGDEDDRFSAGLIHDVARVLAEHGYPPVQVGGDLV